MTSGPQDPQQGGGYGQPPFGQSPSGQPQYGQSPSGQAPYGGPQYGQPPSGQAPYGGPQYGQPPSGQAPYGGPQYGQPPSGQAPYGGPQYGQPPSGQAPYGGPQYGQPGYGQQGFGAHPDAPAGWQGGGAPGAPTERPSTVKLGIGAFLLSTVLGLLSSVLTFSDLSRVAAQLARDSGLSESDASAVVTTGVVISLLFVAAYLLVIWFAWQGRNWARIVLWALGGLSLASAFGAPGAETGILGFLQLLLVLVGIVALALKPSNHWYVAERDRRRAYRG
ncbi:hypothetical protein [Modestobacter marinus]|uniref:hypothetical protein n=1 Tax=Modestobacter marinus TaxID=477641 RepID=UPI001C976ED8|nr:hypothetical protein [Modestobacter marinus]